MEGLGEFLQSRRAGLRPEDVGLASYGERRRVAGLRREELAQLAGVSVSYYIRLEQGQSQNASDEVLAALARALRLTELERRHLFTLARPAAPAAARAPEVERARPGVRQLIDAMSDVPAVLLGRFGDVLAWNRLGHAFLAGHVDPSLAGRPGERPNKVRMLFLDAHMRELYADWPGKTRESVAYLRMLAARHADDPALAALVGDLCVRSPRFAQLWADHAIDECMAHVREYRHPVVGRMTLVQEVMRPDASDQLFLTWTAEPGSPSHAALQLLAAAVRDGSPLPRFSDSAPARS
ncbi:helix-turn-helix domain-containing protein [Dactylosporangium darangshiense]|uniref:helix-turn-helix domain-containing protein n=1 Tax=Dactylosporangium darangshiense TaxID=579108 RepID=UPI0031EAE32A